MVSAWIGDFTDRKKSLVTHHEKEMQVKEMHFNHINYSLR